jgi:spore coat polysaccharide biosynthesis protein SpsF (cytidylyltransferase family)
LKTTAIILARMGSTRLPGKVLMDLGGKPVLEWVIDAAYEANLVDEVVVATPDIRIMEFCADKCRVVGGPEDNVLERFTGAAVYTGSDVVVRLTADCPFVDPGVIDKCIANTACAVNEWPDGLDTQVLLTQWLPMGDREHIVPVNNCLAQLPCPMGNLRHVRVTLDTFSDLENLRKIAEHLPNDRAPYWQETVEVWSELKR